MRRLNKDNVLSMLIKASMPLVAIAGLILNQYVTLGAEFKLNTENTTKAVLSIIALMFFYLPVKDIFIQTFKASRRTRGKINEYANSVNVVYNGNVEKFKAFCEYEYTQRKRAVINRILRNTDLDYDSFYERYKFDTEQVKAAGIRKKDKHAYMAAIREEKRIKAETVDTVLPCGNKRGERKRIKSDARAMSAWNVARKSVSCVISGSVLVSIAVSVAEGANAMEIITTVIMLLGLALWQMFSAYVNARRINNEYCGELSEKTFFLTEFCEKYSLTIPTTSTDEE